MKADSKTLKFGFLPVTIPDGCPDPALFREIIKTTMIAHFKTMVAAAPYKGAWLLTRVVPEPFAANNEAAYHYGRALEALSPDAQAWIAFEEDVNDQFRDYDDDGSGKEPAIPGWTPDHWIVIGG